MGGFALSVFATVGMAQTSPFVKRSGSLEIELRVPESGLFAGENVDVEFRVADTRQADPIEGFRGVINAAPTASITMPEMPGMPVMRPRVHTEGVPGDYGLELFFPHGGEYKIGLRVAPKGETPRYVEFRVQVQDAEARRTPSKPPYALEILKQGTPDGSAPVDLQLAIRDTQSGTRVRRFDVSHTKLLHLILVSKDLRWFAHEHPAPQPDGTFTITQTFPSGGDYILFADSAPKDRGAQVVSAPLHLTGKPAPKATPLSPTPMTTSNLGIQAKLNLPKATAVGESVDLRFEIRDAQTKRPVGDLQPYLGALGHLMIIHQDGRTFVHSHPAEDSKALQAAKRGEVSFRARFPRAGLYKAWVQFQRNGKIATLPYVFRVGGKS